MGKPGTPTDNGIYIVGDKHARLVMDSSTYGVPVNSADGYRTPVDYATQMSCSGIYFHSAPWSVWARQHQHQSRLPQPEPRQCSVGHAEHAARRPGHGEVHPGSATVGRRRSRRLEHPVVGVEEGATPKPSRSRHGWVSPRVAEESTRSDAVTLRPMGEGGAMQHVALSAALATGAVLSSAQAVHAAPVLPSSGCINDLPPASTASVRAG